MPIPAELIVDLPHPLFHAGILGKPDDQIDGKEYPEIDQNAPDLMRHPIGEVGDRESCRRTDDQVRDGLPQDAPSVDPPDPGGPAPRRPVKERKDRLQDHGVQFHYGTQVVNVRFRSETGKKIAEAIDVVRDGQEDTIGLTENDLVFITNGGCVENSAIGSQNMPAPFNKELKAGGGWDMWKKIAAQDPAFGHPEKFCSDPEKTNWMSATVTTLDGRIPEYIQKISRRDPFSGRVVTGGIVTARDSGWLLSWTVNRQPQFRSQPKEQLVVWVYSLFTDKPGDFVKKPMRSCTGREICEEWLYHMGVPQDQIEDTASTGANTVPCMMPYITAFFMPRQAGDRPEVVPEGAVNFAFLGQFAETERDTVFTTEYSIRTGMEAVYTLLNVDRGVPEVWGSVYDIRDLLNASVALRDGKKPTDSALSLPQKVVLKEGLKKVQGTDLEKLLNEYRVI